MANNKQTNPTRVDCVVKVPVLTLTATLLDGRKQDCTVNLGGEQPAIPRGDTKSGRGNISGIRWQEAKATAEKIVAESGYRGFDKLRDVVGCAEGTLRKALEKSPALQQAKTEYEAKPHTPKAVTLTENVLQTYGEPSEGPSLPDIEVDEILADLLETTRKECPEKVEETKNHIADMDPTEREKLARYLKKNPVNLAKESPKTQRQYKQV